ncbi:MAG: hypothetical protein LAO56_15560 [Acidobacteriia bacterium]|nr:hypothetical protein [Terriglobia bacterium]
MAANAANYPWFGVVESDEIEQGDILEGCPVFFPPKDLAITAVNKQSQATFRSEELDLVVMSQSCDLVKGRTTLDDVLLCVAWKRSELTPPNQLARNDVMEDARKGRLPGYHVLAASNIPGFEREVRVVDFRRVHSLPVPFVREKAARGKHLRLLPPYREHLSQSFARFFMRVGLPIDIPAFTGKKK